MILQILLYIIYDIELLVLTFLLCSVKRIYCSMVSKGIQEEIISLEESAECFNTFNMSRLNSLAS
jgi:hypothetical protein